jgi:ABC-type nickel/cobalt efflux system permease component RcnA
MALLTIIALGFVLGMRHATDPDHVIAVTTIVSRQQSMRAAGLIGILWGIGHTITIFVVGAAIILFNLVIPPRVGLTMELAVGLMLILLGVFNVTGLTQRVTGRYTPAHQFRHAVLHSHGDEEPLVRTHTHRAAGHTHVDHRPGAHVGLLLNRIGIYQLLRPLAVGLVHGLAGSAAVALLVLSTIRDSRWAVVYLLVFGAGTIAGMMVITMAVGAPFTYTRSKSANWNRGLSIASGVISMAFGLFITVQIGFVDGLFTAAPRWTPH